MFVCNLLNVAVYATWLVNETDQMNSTQVTIDNLDQK
jgi:hypothetical protein